MAIVNMYDLSTSHLSMADTDALDEYAARVGRAPFRIMRYGYGWVCGVMLIEDKSAVLRLRGAGFSSSFIRIMHSAMKDGCHLIQFDSDAETDPRFKIYNW